MKKLLLGVALLANMTAYASTCSNEQAKNFTTILLNHYRSEFNLPEVTKEELFTERVLYLDKVISEREVSFKTIGELQDFLLNSKIVQETDASINAPLNASVSIAWTLRSNFAAKNGLKKAYKKSAQLDDIFNCH